MKKECCSLFLIIIVIALSIVGLVFFENHVDLFPGSAIKPIITSSRKDTTFGEDTFGYVNITVLFRRKIKNGTETETYLASSIISEKWLTYSEAERFCDHFDLDIVSDEYVTSSNDYLVEKGFWLKSRINLTTGEMEVSEILENEGLHQFER